MHRARLELPSPSSASASAVAAALAVELRDGPDGSSTQVRAEGSVLVLEMTALDVSGLRAGVQNLVRLAEAAIQALGPC